MEVQLYIKVWISTEVKSDTFEGAVQQAESMKVVEFLKKSVVVNDSKIKVIGVFNSDALHDL